MSSISISIRACLPQFNDATISLIQDYAVERDFITATLDHLERINRASLALRKRAEKGDLQAIREGVWYCSDYYTALKKCGKGASALLETFKKQGNFMYGYASSTYFVGRSNSSLTTGREICVFDLKAGVLPSTAIDQLEKGPSLLDCGTVILLAHCLALKEIWGDDRFNAAFRDNLQIDNAKSSLDRLFKRVRISSEDEIQVGDRCFISNIRMYIFKHSMEDARGYNTVCKREEKPKTHIGLGLPVEGATRPEIERSLFESYNATPISPEEVISAEAVKHLYEHTICGNFEASKQVVEALKDEQMTWEEFQRTPSRSEEQGKRSQGKLELSVLRPDLKVIDRLAKVSVSEMAQAYASLS